MTDRELQHYGVLGMKWGVRKNPTKAYVKATKKQRRLDKRARFASEVRDEAKRDLERAKKKEADLTAKARVAQARFDLAANDLNTKTEKYNSARVDPFGAKARAVGEATKRYRSERDAYNKSAKEANEAIVDRAASDDNVKMWAGIAERRIAKSQRWEAAMNTAFKDVSPDAIAAGKAILEKKKRK